MEAGELTIRLSPVALDDGRGALLTTLIRRLADGRPVPIRDVADALSWPVYRVRDAIGQLPSIEIDENGDVVAAGVSLRPTPHVFEVEGRRLYTWCALDTLIFPALIGRTAHVASSCPATGRTIRLVVEPAGVASVDPTDAVVSVAITGGATADVRQAFCNQVHFFSSRDAAAGWAQSHPDGAVLSIADAWALARVLADRLTQEAPSSCC